MLLCPPVLAHVASWKGSQKLTVNYCITDFRLRLSMINWCDQIFGLTRERYDQHTHGCTEKHKSVLYMYNMSGQNGQMRTISKQIHTCCTLCLCVLEPYVEFTVTSHTCVPSQTQFTLLLLAVAQCSLWLFSLIKCVLCSDWQKKLLEYTNVLAIESSLVSVIIEPIHGFSLHQMSFCPQDNMRLRSFEQMLMWQ